MDFFTKIVNLRWTFFTKIVNCHKLPTILAKILHRKGFTETCIFLSKHESLKFYSLQITENAIIKVSSPNENNRVFKEKSYYEKP